MFELRSKVSDQKFSLSIADMSMYRTIMYHAGVPPHIIERFGVSNGTVIGEVAAQTVGKALDKALVPLSQGIAVERRVVRASKVVSVAEPLALLDLILLKAFCEFCKTRGPFEVH